MQKAVGICRPLFVLHFPYFCFMTASQSLKLYQLFQRLTKDEAEAQAFVQEVEAVIDNKFEQKRSELATKEDIAKIELKIVDSKAETIKWMFIFWVGSVFAILGGLFGFLKLFLNK